MARICLIFSFAFTGFIMLSMSQIALGVSKVGQLLPQPAEAVVLSAPGGLATAEKTGNTDTQTPAGGIKRGGVIGATSAKGLVQLKDRGVQGGNLNEAEVYHHSTTDHLDIANGGAVVTRDVNTKVNLEKGQVITEGKAGANIPKVASVKTGAAGVSSKNSKKVNWDLPMM
ncbi:uncharacterized protein LOC113323339 [Papaver somniferum]|uniref:uncharacterized protein LOC113323339 n=1 Tax=Papaver somniferum TaxID=3469 RepID=UPI000E6FA12A|nr:uncharacterized protein LOC113323339 [Papaver somniferum]